VKHWKIAEVAPGSAEAIAAKNGLPVPVAKILVLRGLTGQQAIDRFLNPRLSELSDPFSISGMRAAVDRIVLALAAREPIVVYGDYDADGITATALMTRVLLSLGADVTPYLPSRMEFGYGLSVAGVEQCASRHKPRLIVTVDCGTNDHEAVSAAARLGIDVIVTDHHEAKKRVAEPVSLVNPNMGTDAGTRALAGVGVAFKVCHAVLKQERERGNAAAAKIDLKQYLDLVAIGTVADVVPLVGENRALVRSGIQSISKNSSVGLKALIDASGIGAKIETYHLGYVIGPRFNAVGRLGKAEFALELVLTDDPQRAGELAGILEEANRDRIRVEKETMDRAMIDVGRLFDPGRDACIALGGDGWHIGVLGLVASRLCKMHSRPVLVVSFDSDGEGKGSGRSIPGFDLVKGLEECSDLLVGFGGHAAAAGLTIQRKNFEAFAVRFREVCRKKLEGVELRPVQRIDAVLDLREADKKFMEAMDCLKPFGEGNPEPVWCAAGLDIVGEPRSVKGDHLQLTLAAGGTQMSAIAFGMGKREIPAGKIDVAFTIGRNSYRGNERLQMQIKDFRKSHGDIRVDDLVPSRK